MQESESESTDGSVKEIAKLTVDPRPLRSEKHLMVNFGAVVTVKYVNEHFSLDYRTMP